MKKSAYLAFTSTGYRVMNILITLFFMVGGFFLYTKEGTFTIIMISGTMPLVLAFVDYCAFSGTSQKKQKSMSLLRSSYRGAELFKNALKTDLILKEIYLTFAVLGYLIAVIINCQDSESLWEAVLTAMIYMPIARSVLYITLIMTRRKGLVMATQVLICYVGSMINMLLLMLYSFLLPEDINDYKVYIFIMFVILEAVGIFCCILLYRDCRKAYISGFEDA